MTVTHAPSSLPAPPLAPTTPNATPPTARRRFGRGRELAGWIGRMALMAGAIGLSFLIDSGIFTAIAVLFALVVPFEKLYPRQKGQKLRRPLWRTDVAFALMAPLLNAVGITAFIVIGGFSLFWIPGLLSQPLVSMIPPVALPFVGFLLFDFLVYWTHRWAHEVPFMWRFHSVHHSPEHMDWVSGFRVHPFDGAVIAPGFFFLLGAGFGAELAGIFAIFQIILGIFFHANVRVRWRPLDRVACNPEFHHWHHSSEHDAVGHNYGAALPWWDQVFGTFFMPKKSANRRPQHYGVSDPLPKHLLGKLSYPCRGARNHLWLWRRPVLALRTLKVATGNLWRGIWRSTTRPTHSVRRQVIPGCTTSNASLLGAEAVPNPVGRPLPVRTPSRRQQRKLAKV